MSGADEGTEPTGDRFARAPLRVGFVPVIRPVFKGDAAGAARASRAALERLGAEHAFELVTAEVGSLATQAYDGARVPPEAVTDAGEARRAAAELAAAELDLLLVQHTTFATGDLLAPLLAAHSRVGVWALPESAGGRGDSGPLPLNAFCGLNMTLSLLDRSEVDRRGPVKWFYGTADDPRFLERFEPTLAALRGLRALAGATVLQIGGTAPGFYGIDERPDALASLGASAETRPLDWLFERVAAVGAADAEARAEAMRPGHRTEVTPEQLTRAARIELALERAAAETGADALAVRCWPELPDACDSMACAAMGDLSGAGVPAACEGDVMGALSMLALQGVAGGSAILMDLADVDAQRNAWQVWHCGNAPLAWATNDAGEGGSPPRLTTHFNRDGAGTVRDMTIAPGSASGFRLLDGGRGAAIVSGRFVDPERAGFDGVRGWLGELRWNGAPIGAWQAAANVLEHRLPHHLAFARGEHDAALAELCGWLGATPVAAHAVPPHLAAAFGSP